MDKEMFEKTLIFDMEMIPVSQEKEPQVREFFQGIGKHNSEMEDAIELTSVDGAFGRILCIGYVFGDQEIKIIFDEHINERIVLESFWKLVQEADLVVGHKIVDSDLLFLHQRSLVHGVRPSKNFDLSGKDSRVFDTAWGWGLGKKYASLEKISLALDIPSPKKLMHGSQVPEYYRNGRVNEILTYCKSDVSATREIYKKMLMIFS
ncbi:MAG: hypothetical protein IPN70_00710 [Candidatus Moraniibacteriota bacterium]|nr:MAG: hypothetical protein IPN70_00710 [Candidatus Moranbacteria bacterium]